MKSTIGKSVNDPGNVPLLADLRPYRGNDRKSVRCDSGRMNEAFFAELSAWLTQAGLAGTSEIEIVSGFCDRCVAAGLPLFRTVVLIDTLHPVHEGRLFRWGPDSAQPPLLEYGRTSPDGLAATGFDPKDVQAAARWRNSPFYRMLETGDLLLRRRVNAATKNEFAWLSDLYAEGATDYVAIINRFAADGVIGEMDGVYSSWATRTPDGFSEDEIATLKRLVPYLALAVKSVSLARMTGTLMETYLGRDAGQRVLSGRICAAFRIELKPSFGSVICAASRGSPTLHRSRQSRY